MKNSENKGKEMSKGGQCNPNGGGNKSGGKRNRGRNNRGNRNPDSGRKSNDRAQATKDDTQDRVNLDNARVGKLMRLLKADNDATWYTRNPELLKAATQLPFATIAGAPNMINDLAVPGIMTIEFAPSFGSDELYPTAINQAGKSIYSYLVHANSRNYTYEYQDLMIMIIAAAQVYAAIAAGERAYGLAKYYLEQNRYIPEDLLKACGWDPQSIRRDLGNMWFGLNELIARTQQIWIPNTFPVIQRWMWLNSNVYVDSPDARAQMYVFKQNTFYQYDATLTQQGGGLKPISLFHSSANDSGLITWDSYYNTVSGMIDALINDEDRGVIFGDILNAYGSDKIYSRPPFSSDYTVAPVFSQEVLMQIENLTTGSLAEPRGLIQTTDGLTTVWKAATVAIESVAGQVHPAAAVLNLHAPNAPTPENLAVATRLQALGEELAEVYVEQASGAPKLGSAFVPLTCGTEVVNHVYLRGAEFTTGTRKVVITEVANTVSSTPGYQSQYITVTGMLMAFDWHPFVYVIPKASASATQFDLPWQASGDYDNFIWLTVPEAQKIHDTCVYSLFGLPIV